MILAVGRANPFRQSSSSSSRAERARGGGVRGWVWGRIGETNKHAGDGERVCGKTPVARVSLELTLLATPSSPVSASVSRPWRPGPASRLPAVCLRPVLRGGVPVPVVRPGQSLLRGSVQCSGAAPEHPGGGPALPAHPPRPRVPCRAPGRLSCAQSPRSRRRDASGYPTGVGPCQRGGMRSHCELSAIVRPPAPGTCRAFALFLVPPAVPTHHPARFRASAPPLRGARP